MPVQIAGVVRRYLEVRRALHLIKLMQVVRDNPILEEAVRLASQNLCTIIDPF